MQIEKYVHITKTPNGALVSFAGQVCLIIVGSPDSEMFFWRASPMFLKLTTGANAFSVPQSYTPHSSMAQAVADGLTKLDELGAFYGVIDMPEDTYVGEHLTEETEEDVEAMLAESFVVRKTEKKRGVKSRTMISAAAVLGRAAELAKEAGEKSGPKWIKMAHKEYSTIKAESEEFVQYEDAIIDGLASIKEDCRAEALSMCDSLLEAQQLAAELFEDISEEYLLNELSKATLGSYAKKSNVARTYEPNDYIADNRGTGVMRALDKLAGKKAGPLKGKAITAHWSAASSGVTADKANKDRASFEKAVDKLTKEEVEALDESLVPDRMKGKQKPYVSADGKGGYEVLGNTGQTKASFNRATHGKDAHAMAQKHLKSKYDEYMNEEVLDEATRPLSGDAYWKAKEVESKEEYLKAQRKALGLPEPVKRGRGKPTNIDRDLLKTRAHSNVEAGKRPTAGFDRNEKIHFVRHLKDHPDFAEKHVSKAGRPTGTTKVASQQQALVKKKQDTAFSMWAGLGKK